jgi:hypothetical protein
MHNDFGIYNHHKLSIHLEDLIRGPMDLSVRFSFCVHRTNDCAELDVPNDVVVNDVGEEIFEFSFRKFRDAMLVAERVGRGEVTLRVALFESIPWKLDRMIRQYDVMLKDIVKPGGYSLLLDKAQRLKIHISLADRVVKY